MKRISCALVATMTATALLHPGSTVALETFGKTANPSSGAAPLTVVYTYTLDNTQGDHRLESVFITDFKCSPVVFSGGDLNGNNILDIGEVWTWTCSAVVNTTTANTAQTSYQYTTCQDLTCLTTYVDFTNAYATVSITPAPLSVSIRGKPCASKNQLVNLTALVAGGTPPYTFAWTTGETSQTITPSTSVAGSFPFGVTVTDHSGTTASANTQLTVALSCVTEIGVKTVTPEFPLLTTIEWGCDWQFAGVCLNRTIVKLCIGGHCIDNPAVPGPPVCKVCGTLIGVGAGFALALAAGLLLKKMRGRNIGSGTRFDGRPE